MKTQFAFVRLSLIGLAISALAIGGCSDNTSAVTSTSHKSVAIADQVQTQHISSKANSLAIPNIFADCITSTDGKDAGEVSSFDDSFSSRRSSDEAGELPTVSTVLTVPARVEASIAAPYVIAENDNPDGRLVCDLDVKGVELEGGTRYTITFDDVNHSGLSCLDFQPNVRIVSQEDYRDGNLNNNLELELIAPDPQTRYVSLSFVAPEDGTYCVTVGDTTTKPSEEPTEEDFCYTIYPDANKVGMSIVLTDEINGQEFAYTNEEVQDMRSSLRPYIESWDNGFPSKLSDKTINGQTWQEALDEAIARIKLGHTASSSASADADSQTANLASGEVQNSGTSAKADSNSPKTVLEAIVDKQAWDSATMDIGYGFNAVSGRPARKLCAIQPVTLTKEREPFSADTYMRLIENSTQQEKAMGVSLSTTFSGSSATVSSSASVRDVYKYNATSTTLQIYYENCATQPTKLGLSEYKLNDAAKALLARDPAAFRATYGDYFIAGAYYGAKYVGNIAIRTSSTEHMNTVKQKLSALIAAQKVDEEFSRELKDVLKDCDISLSVHTEGGSDVSTSATKVAANVSASDHHDYGGAVYGASFHAQPLSFAVANNANEGAAATSCSNGNALSIDALIQGYQNFKKSVETSSNPNLAKIYAYMLEFSQIPDCASLSDELSVSPEVFISIRNVCRDYLRLTSAINEYCGLPEMDFRDGHNHLQQVRADYDDLSTRFKTSLRDASVNPDNFIAAWSKSIADAYKTAETRLERYYFVRRLSEANAAIGAKDLQPNRNVLFGYSQYLHSEVCNHDFIGASQVGKHNSWKVGRHYWNPRVRCQQNSSAVAAGIEWTNNSNKDECHFTYFPPLCRQEVGVDCKGGYDRGVNWDVKVYWLDPANYKELILPNERT